ncbi:ubiquitin thiolesterase, putative peptidase C19 [Trachipleistophora hominis]|uniref:Ubiquitin thiolesterase, putative peptidase C19 n=1 Tax=Trachipleistophora hominis TaxID=72359 RepID=L7JTC2_TRAHO|nr:ubiquitin thiolesterase, putative peptidase C19 [Trachipleistophora hominis]
MIILLYIAILDVMATENFEDSDDGYIIVSDEDVITGYPGRLGANSSEKLMCEQRENHQTYSYDQYMSESGYYNTFLDENLINYLGTCVSSEFHEQSQRNLPERGILRLQDSDQELLSDMFETKRMYEQEYVPMPATSLDSFIESVFSDDYSQRQSSNFVSEQNNISDMFETKRMYEQEYVPMPTTLLDPFIESVFSDDYSQRQSSNFVLEQNNNENADFYRIQAIDEVPPVQQPYYFNGLENDAIFSYVDEFNSTSFTCINDASASMRSDGDHPKIKQEDFMTSADTSDQGWTEKLLATTSRTKYTADTISFLGKIQTFLDRNTILVPSNDGGSGPTGLPNKQSNCFFNASIQMLYASQSFVDFIKSDSLKSLCSMETLRLIHDMLKKNEKNVWDVFLKLCASSKKLIPYGNILEVKQHDAVDFLVDLFEEIWNMAGDKSIHLEYPFAFISNEISICATCQKPTSIKQFENCYVLDLKAEPSINSQLVMFNCLEEDIRSGNIKRCKHVYSCEHTNTILKTCANVPKLIIIRIERNIFDSVLQKTKKNVAPIDTEEHITINTRDYRLKSFIMHFGEDNAGHFTAVVRKGIKWYHVNDDVIGLINDIHRFLKGNPYTYLLLYQRTN